MKTLPVACYPQNGKRKSLDICRAFAQGCGGEVVTDGVYRWGQPAMFYGVDADNEEAWRSAHRQDTPDCYYADNAYFDQLRGTYFRVAKNSLQHDGSGRSDGSRFKKLGITLAPWRKDGGHVLVTPQSDHFMRVVVGRAMWLKQMLRELKDLTKREVLVREWNRDKKKLAAELPAALHNAWALVTWSSGSAISAIISGIPAISVALDSIAHVMSGSLATIEAPLMPEREPWLHVVADRRWTLEEFRDGTAWRALQ